MLADATFTHEGCCQSLTLRADAQGTITLAQMVPAESFCVQILLRHACPLQAITWHMPLQCLASIWGGQSLGQMLRLYPYITCRCNV